jgi:hypothetical protein
MQQNSEVACLVAQINNEYEAARLGLSGLAQGVSQHEFITKRMENIAGLYKSLHGIVGDEGMRELAEQEDDRGGQEDPELAAISSQLRETASYAIDPAFKERLRLQLLEMMR